ncbi:hypothetical protein FRC03_005942 [Tulasnella sp. 419]|nr:hypothetical protein FRC03_005942 [Tulasnella sp. 419]
MGKHELVERLYLDGIEDREVRKGIAASQNKEIKDFKKEETGKDRVRMLIPQSRLLFGVCDPYKVLRPGEVHVRITTRTGATTLKAVDVMVIRNPCLHPGDLLKLRATDHPQLSHLVDCVVFSSVGKRPAPSMSSGGDLDGDKFMVCWDEKIVPKKIAESYDYPAPKERISGKITRTDLANHFASYNAISLGRISTLHRKWAIAKGAMSPECQELNALHSQCVDGAGIKIPDRLQTPPEGTEPFVLDVLAEKAKEFAAQFTAIQEAQGDSDIYSQDAEDVHDRLIRLLKSDDPSMAMSEFELVQLVLRKCRQSGLDVHRYLPYINWNALSAQEKYMLGSYFVLNPEIHSQMWNSLLQSNIVRPQDLTARGLNRPLRLQRLYSSEMQGRANFFEYFKYATQDFVRKVVLVRMDNRFSIGIFIRGKYEWDADPLVGGQVAVCSFQPTASQVLATYRTATVDYRLHASDNRFQLYNKNLANTFIFINRPPPRSDADLTISIALQQINANVQRQIGRINREHVTAVEIHVVSPRDREAHQLFDLRFSHVPTEELMRRFAYEKVPWLQNSLRTIDWEAQEPHVREIMRFTTLEQFKAGLHDLTLEAIGDVLNVAITYHSNDHASIAFEHVLQLADPPMADIAAWLDQLPALAHLILKNRLEPGSQLLPPPFSRILMTILQCIIRSANEFGIMALVALEKLKDSICLLDFAHYAELLWLAAHSVRYFHLCQEILMVLSDCREEVSSRSPSATYAHHHALAVVSNRAQEANAECRCDPNGRPAKQKQAPLHVKIFPVDGESRAVKVHVRVDSPSPVRLGSHVRLRAEMVAQNDTQSVRQFTMDGIVNQSSKGELRVDLLHTPPPELTQMQWLMYHAGITTTSRAMLDAIIKLDRERRDVCRLFGIITGEDRLTTQYEERILANVVDIDLSRFNDSQQAAILSASNPLSLIWGPPGTGKTTVVVALLSLLVKNLADEEKILMTASTHNAVDNVLERFIELGILDDSEILRVATDVSKVNKKLQKYTIDAQIGGSTLDNPRLIKQAEKRAKDAVIVFTTCTGAGLGVLRKIDFGLVIIDEASQVTEPDSLIPLVKGCKQAVLVGDHVQLRPTVQPFGKALQFDVSLMERLYTSDTAQTSGISRIMLNVQYRFPLALARFPSTEFYNGELQTGTIWTPAHDERMRSQFPWPVDANRHLRTNVFVPCAAEEDMCRSSKSNQGQVSLVAHIVKLLQESTFPSENIELQPPSIAVITPYTRQLKELKQKLPPSVTISTIDGFQGRESDIIVYTTVRCNEMRDIGFLDDARRLNVAWTRARLGRIIVGHRSTLTENSPLWGRALDDCEEVIIDLPAEEHGH